MERKNCWAVGGFCRAVSVVGITELCMHESIAQLRALPAEELELQK